MDFECSRGADYLSRHPRGAAGHERPGGFEESSNRVALLASAVGSMLALTLRIFLSSLLLALILLVRSMYGRALALVLTLLAGILRILLPEVLLSRPLLIRFLLIALLRIGVLLISVGHDVLLSLPDTAFPK